MTTERDYWRVLVGGVQIAMLCGTRKEAEAFVRWDDAGPDVVLVDDAGVVVRRGKLSQHRK